MKIRSERNNAAALKSKPESAIESMEARPTTTKVAETSANVPKNISQRELLLIKLDINHHLRAKDYDAAMDVVKGAVGRTNASLTRSAIAQSGLWVLRMMINDSPYFGNCSKFICRLHANISAAQ